jgi:hypothetical protein
MMAWGEPSMYLFFIWPKKNENSEMKGHHDAMICRLALTLSPLMMQVVSHPFTTWASKEDMDKWANRINLERHSSSSTSRTSLSPPNPIQILKMSWKCTGKTHNDLIANLWSYKILKTKRIKDSFQKVDRAHFTFSEPYVDSPQVCYNDHSFFFFRTYTLILHYLFPLLTL